MKSFGCKVNIAEEELIMSKLLSNGFTQTSNLELAEILIINSCAVTETAAKKVEDYIKKSKEKLPHLKIVMTGCLANDKILKSTDNIDLVVDNFSKELIVENIITYLGCNTENIVKILDDKSIFTGIVDSDESKRTRNYFKIQDGCDAKCSYCIIPTLRGRSKSLDINLSVESFTNAVNSGYKEIVLVGIHIGLYGKEHGYNFTELVKRLIKVKGDFRIRFSSLEVNEIDDELINIMKDNPDKISAHLHIPLQSGSDNILKLMNRFYLKDEYINTALKAKEQISNLTIGSDIIVGFPSETDDDFNDTIQTLSTATTDFFHIFQYSDRTGTKASSMDNKIDPTLKKKRMKILQELASKRYQDLVDISIGKTFRVLTEKGDKGHTDNYLNINLNNNTTINIKPNKFHNVVITEFKDNKLYGDIIPN